MNMKPDAARTDRLLRAATSIRYQTVLGTLLSTSIEPVRLNFGLVADVSAPVGPLEGGC